MLYDYCSVIEVNVMMHPLQRFIEILTIYKKTIDDLNSLCSISFSVIVDLALTNTNII